MKDYLLKYMKTLVFSYIITGIVIFALAFISYIFGLHDKGMNVGIYIGYAIVLISSFFVLGKMVDKKRIVHYIIFSVLYFSIIFLANFLKK